MKTVINMPRYSVYKDSGVDWLGDVPEAWHIKRLGSYFIERRTKVSDKDYPALSVTKMGILSQLENAAKTNDGDNRKLVKKGDFVINSRSDRKGSSGVSNLDGSVSLINIVLQPKFINPQFTNYLLKNYSFVEEFYRIGHGIVADLWTTRYEDMKNIFLSIPSQKEQITIVDFLDKKTTQIDQAISIKQKQIELLKERQQIIIQQAVTKGLDPNVPMKDSGIEWIGIIPAHWVITKLKFVSTINNGQDYKQVESDNGFPVIGSGGQFAFANSYLYDGEAVLLGRKGTIDKPLYINGKFWTVDTMFFAICKKTILTKYLYYCAKTIPFLYYSTATALPSMTQKDLLNHKIVLPLLSEQRKIINFVDQQIAITNDGIQCYQKQIEKLKEYKITLIDSAVTGKIKITSEE